MLKKSWLPNSLRWLLAVLSCYRVAQMIATEEGPGGVLLLLRARAGAYDYDEDGGPRTNLGRGVVCPLCVGLYVAALMAILVAWPTRVGDLVLGWLGISGAQAFLVRVSEE